MDPPAAVSESSPSVPRADVVDASVRACLAVAARLGCRRRDPAPHGRADGCGGRRRQGVGAVRGVGCSPCASTFEAGVQQAGIESLTGRIQGH